MSRRYVDVCTYWPPVELDLYTHISHLPSGNIDTVGKHYACKWDAGLAEKILVKGEEVISSTKVTLATDLELGGFLALGKHNTTFHELIGTTAFPIHAKKVIRGMSRFKIYYGYYL